MLPTVELYNAISIAERKKLFDSLNEIYSELPRTSCKNCASCCKWGSPPAFFIEYLNMYKFVRDHLHSNWESFLTRSAEYFYLELVDTNQTCPFVSEDNKCLVYEVRPLTCRVYGLLSKREFEMGDRAQGLKFLADKLWEEYQIKVPEEIANGVLPWCGNVRNSTRRRIKKEVLAGIATKVAKLDTNYFPVYMVDNEETMFPYPVHLMNTVLGDGARARKIKIMKEFANQGTKEQLMPIVNRVGGYEF